MLCYIQKKSYSFFFLIIIFFFFNGFVNGQALTISPGVSSHTKTYVNQWLQAPRAVDQFGVPSAQNRRIKLVLTGPARVPLNSKQHFTLRLLTENWSQNSSKPNTAYIDHFIFYFLSTNGYVELVDKPKYTVMAKNSLTRTVVKDIPAEWRKFYQYFSRSGGAFIKALPVLGKLLDLSENLAQSAELINQKDVNWGELWYLTSEYDVYPVPKPIYCNPSAFYRMVEIDIPFIKKKKNGQLLFIADSIAVQPFAQEEPAVMFKTFDKVLLSNGYPEVLSPMIQPKTAKLTQAAPVANFPPKMFLKVNYQLMEGMNGNIISLDILPASKLHYSARIENVYCAIEAPKSTIAVSGRPQYFNFDGQEIDGETLKDQSNKKLLKDWGKFALSFIPSVDAVMSLFSVWQTSVKAMHYARASTSFSALIKKKWAYEQSTNFFPLPPLGNNSALEPDGLLGCTLKIPVDIYSFDVPKVNLLVNGYLNMKKYYNPFTCRILLDFNKEPEVKSLKDIAILLVKMLKFKQFSKFSHYIHPKKGLRISPAILIYSDDLVFTPSQFSNLFFDDKKYFWGYVPETDNIKIELTFKELYKKYLFDRDYTKPDKISIDKVYYSSYKFKSVEENIKNQYPNSRFVEFHSYPRNDTAAELRLIFERYKGKWFLVAISCDYWTP